MVPVLLSGLWEALLFRVVQPIALQAALDDFVRRVDRHVLRRSHGGRDHLGLVLIVALVRLAGIIDGIGSNPGEPLAEQQQHRPERRGQEGTHAAKGARLKGEMLVQPPNKRNEDNYCSSEIKFQQEISNNQTNPREERIFFPLVFALWPATDGGNPTALALSRLSAVFIGEEQRPEPGTTSRAKLIILSNDNICSK